VLGIAYLAHALIDYDWDFIAVTAPLLLVLGVLLAAGRPQVAGRNRPLLAAGVALAAVTAVVSLASPWLAGREVDNAYAALDRRQPGKAVEHGRNAQSLNPLSVEPLFAEAAGEDSRGNPGLALDLFVQAVELQPQNPRTWFELGRFELEIGLRQAAIRHLTRSSELDPWGPAPRLLERIFSS
jgi:tetratricopeptide (TPR) repeat protein